MSDVGKAELDRIEAWFQVLGLDPGNLDLREVLGQKEDQANQ